MKVFAELVRDALFSIVFHLAPRFANVLLFILIGRLAGPGDAGVFALATTYLLIFTTVMRGLDDLVVRQVSREPDQAASYLADFLRLRLVTSLVLYAVLLFIVQAIFDYSHTTSQTILILSLSLTPDSLMYVAQSILLGQRRFAIPATVLAGVSLFKLVGGALLIFLSGTLQHVAWLWLAGSVIGMILMIGAAVQGTGGYHLFNRWDYTLLKRHRHAALSFLLITTLATLETQIDTIVLSGFHDETQVGLYGAATTVAYSLVMFSQAYRFAVYPLMSRYALHAPEKLSRLYEQSMRYLGIFVLPMVAGIILLSPQLVPFIFGSQFRPTVQVLQILSLTLVFMFLIEPNVRMMLVHERQNQISLFLFSSAAMNVFLNIALVPAWGASGAATARVCSALLFFLLCHFYVNRFLTRLNVLQLLFRPALATLVMAFTLLLVRTSLPLAILVGFITYAIALKLVGGVSSVELTQLYKWVTRKHQRTAMN